MGIIIVVGVIEGIRVIGEIRVIEGIRVSLPMSRRSIATVSTTTTIGLLEANPEQQIEVIAIIISSKVMG